MAMSGSASAELVALLLRLLDRLLSQFSIKTYY